MGTRIASIALLLVLAACQKNEGPPTAPGGAMSPVTSRAAPTNSTATPVRELADARDADEVASEARPGLGTEFGEQRTSVVVDTPFHRASTSPDLVLALWYDDFDGVRRASDRIGRGALQPSRISSPRGSVAVTIVDDAGATFSAADIAGRRHVIAEAGDAYHIGIENHADERLEVVASVDGLDVIDGTPADVDKRGYVIEPLSSISIDGWRTSEASVAAFRFAAVEDSYADRTGQSRNIGVIGVAFFREDASAAARDLQLRRAADPFPGGGVGRARRIH